MGQEGKIGLKYRGKYEAVLRGVLRGRIITKSRVPLLGFLMIRLSLVF